MPPPPTHTHTYSHLMQRDVLQWNVYEQNYIDIKYKKLQNIYHETKQTKPNRFNRCLETRKD